ncbi:AIR carboxylase family protein [Bacteriovorax sp. DB6_IX]|uniref:AIR carboxylase family protein n=1 Tax=Bacteriovorax sp. DB6_IX TaxID=1353530 RepID=UPI00038A2A5A|nr:AIR carboxylase family protein [Bacteriovorax sp. DB6_IX]EQC51630.1 putative phosphoribosylaminoimidazole carboxylase [Bacteriovorax sp. DB6_IX]
MKALVLFGSESDKHVYQELIISLEKEYKEVDFEVISAHRNPERLNERLAEDNFDVIYAGAGIAAHLPGVCASLSKRPVVGIPVEGNLGGLDALLSIQQMPFGVPVATMGSRKWSSLPLLKECLKGNELAINIIIPEQLREMDFVKSELERTERYLKDSNIEYSIGSYNPNCLNINLVNRYEDILSDKPCLQVPIFNSQVKNDPQKALELLKWSNMGGFWFGINNTRNAICFARKL